MWKVPPRSWKRLKLFLALVALAACLLLLPSRLTAPVRVLFNEAVGPLETAVFQGAGGTLGASGTLTEMFIGEDRERALAAEVTRLRNRNLALDEQCRRLQEALNSIEKLGLKQLPFRIIRAPVASYDASAMHGSITVRAGRKDGVDRGMAVTAYGALVAVVVEAGPSQSRARLIVDADSALPCRLSRTRALCILQGTGGEDCRVDWLDRDSFVEQGDLVVTASLRVDPQSELRVPDGLPAATVTRVERDTMRPLFLSVEAVPRVNLDRLEAVEILVPEQP